MRKLTLIQSGGLPTTGIMELCHKHGLSRHVSIGMRADEISELMQEHWMRKTPHQYQIPGGLPDAYDLRIFRNLGLVDRVHATAGHFDGALVLGGLITAVRKRLAFLAHMHNFVDWPTTVENVYLLGGTRDLDKEKERPQILATAMEGLPFKPNWKAGNNCFLSTEDEMMRLVLEQSALPEQWKGTVVRSGRQPDGKGGIRLPNTEDTVRAWAREAPPAGTYLVVSSQPYVQRQTINVERATVETGLGNLFQFVGIGYQAPDDFALAKYLDELARLLFEEVKIFQSK